MAGTPRMSQIKALVQALINEYEATEAVGNAPDGAAFAAAKSALARAQTVAHRAHANATPGERLAAMRIIRNRR